MTGPRKPAHFLLRLLLASLAFVLALVAADRVLLIAGAPSDSPAHFAHPPDFFERRVNLDFEHSFRTNSLGLRDRELPEEKAPGEVRLLILGDSFVEGYGVEAEQTFVALLEAAHSEHRPAVRFINGGLSGAGPFEYARLYHRLGARLDPDWVVLCVYPNDLTATGPDSSIEAIYAPPERSGWRKVLYALLPRIYTRVSLSGVLRSRRSEDFVQKVSVRARAIGRSEEEIARWRVSLPDDIVAAVDQGRFNGAILASGVLTPDYWVESLDLEGPRALAKWQAMAHLLDEVAKLARQSRQGFALIYIPSRFQYAAPGANRRLWEQSGTRIRDAWRTKDSELQGRLIDWSAQRDVPLLDLTPAFRARSGDHSSLLFPRDDHWTPAGHRLAAQAIGAWLAEIGALQPRVPE